MNAEFVNPFLESANLVFKDLLGLTLLRGKTTIKTNPIPERDIAILIGVNGKVGGQVIYSMNIETVYKIVRKLMPGIEHAAIKDEYRDILGELANMITGNALNIFLTNNTDLDVTVPMVADARSGELQFKDQQTLGLNMYSRFGMLEVNIALK